MVRFRACSSLLMALAVFPSNTAKAQETTTYTYDALGRLVTASKFGGPDSGAAHTIGYDAAGNRTNYAVTGANPATANIAIGNASVTEGGSLVFTVTRSGNTAVAASVSFSTAGGTAVSGADFTPSAGTVNFAVGQTTVTIVVATIDDAAIEATETMTVTLANPSGNAAITGATGTGTIIDDEVAPANLAIGNASATEGGVLIFTVTRSGNTAIAASASYATVNGTAIAGSDYVATSGVVAFAAGQTTATISVATTDDAVFESTEAMTVVLSNPAVNTSIVTSTGTGTIADNDTQLSLLSLSGASAAEGDNLVFTVTRSGNTSIAVSASYSTSGGTATSGSDFTASSGTVSFAAGQTTATITVATLRDVTAESAEAMTVTLSNPSANASISNASATGTISDVPPAYFSIGNASGTEGGTLTFTVSRTGNTAIATSVNWATANGTADASTDYFTASGTLYFAAGQTTATINVTTRDDTVLESTEAMTVSLSAPAAGSAISSGTGTGTILDDEVPPAYLATSGATAVEGSPLVFTVTRTGNTAIPASMNYATFDGGGIAKAGSDFVASSGTVSLAAGQTTATISIATIDDSIVEDGENMSITLSAPSANTIISNNSAIGQINDNDVSPPAISINDVSASEGQNLIFTVRLSAAYASTVTVNYATATGTATALDFTAQSGTLTFAPGVTSATISIVTRSDKNTLEGNEYMYVNLSGVTGGATISDSQGQGTIIDVTNCPTC